MDFLKSAVASAMAKGPPFPYTFGDKVDLDPSIWTLYNGTRRVWPHAVLLLFMQTFRPTLPNGCVAGRRLELQHLFLRHLG